MAKRVVEIVLCDPCTVKGEESEAVGQLTIGGDAYDMCGVHQDRFRDEFRKLFVPAGSSNVQNIA
jgi:hypothetical protein